jgi:hypothetical protein
MTAIILCFVLINYVAHSYFDWDYFSTRIRGVWLTICSITVSVVVNLVVYAWSRKKLFFEFKPPEKDVQLAAVSYMANNDSRNTESQSVVGDKQNVVQTNKWVSVLWNAIALFVIIFICLLIWFSRMYMSYCCFSSRNEIMTLCEMTNEVQCYPCSKCISNAIHNCSMDKLSQFHCLSPMDEVDQSKGAICIFNYNVGLFTFILVFAYIGGVYFLFFNITRAITNYFIDWVYQRYIWCLRRYHKWKYSRDRSAGPNLLQVQDT